VRHWDASNRPPEPDARISQLYARTNPKHYHVQRGMQTLVGHRANEPWFGNTCPPECPGLLDGEGYMPMEPYHAEGRERRTTRPRR